MVLILDGNSEHIIIQKYPIFYCSRLLECLKQFKYLRLLLTCAHMSELPSNISTILPNRKYTFKTYIHLHQTSNAIFPRTLVNFFHINTF